MTNLSPTTAVTAAISAGKNDTAKMTDAVCVCFAALADPGSKHHRDVSQINRLIEWMAGDGRRADMGLILYIGTTCGPLARKNPVSGSDADWRQDRLALGSQKRQEKEGAWNAFQTIRADMTEHGLNADGVPSFRVYANHLKALNAEPTNNPKSLAEKLVTLADSKKAKQKYPENMLVRIKKLAREFEKFDADAEKAPRALPAPS